MVRLVFGFLVFWHRMRYFFTVGGILPKRAPSVFPGGLGQRLQDRFALFVWFRSDRSYILGKQGPPSPVGSANDVAVTSPDVTRCHGVSQGDRERSR